MSGRILLSTAYLPPAVYFSLISRADEIIIEREENYIKQSYRNRCYILSAHGPQLLTVPVYLGSQHKEVVKDIRIDYSKRWQQVHLRAMISSYKSSPFFEFYFENIEKIISKNHEFLLDLNICLIQMVSGILKLEKTTSHSSHFEPVENMDYDFRYRISPKRIFPYQSKEYMQVFNSSNGFVTGLSIVDLIFNKGPESGKFI